jgi:hypothetical protein
LTSAPGGRTFGPVQVEESPLRVALRFAQALGVNLIPTSIDRRPQVDWAGLAHPAAPRIDRATLGQWVRREQAELAAGRVDARAWALLPGSGRYAVFDVDDPALVPHLLRVHGETPMVVRSPNAGRAHLWYRWPDLPGIDLASRGKILGPDTYELKARGATIHAPGSMHHHRRGRYACDLQISEIVPGLGARLPEVDLAAVAADWASAHEPVEVADRWGKDRWSTDGEGERRFAAYVERVGGTGRGSRQSTLYRLCSKAGDLGLPLNVARPMMLAWAEQCEPPVPAEDVKGGLARAYQNRRSPIGCDLVGDGSDLVWGEDEET